MEYPVVLERDKEAGGYVVYCPTLRGCVSQGETEEEALENIKDAIRTYLLGLEDLKTLKRMRTVEVTL
jgi:predicted RNase H-like HicB family nuclease